MGWDDMIEGEVEQDLQKILVEMVNVQDIKFPRAVVQANVKPEFELLGFWDREKSASASVPRPFPRFNPLKGI